MFIVAGPPALTVNIMKNTESSSIVVQWDEVDDSLPTAYVVTWTNERDHNLQFKTLEEQSSYTITGLTLDTVYTITVTASNMCGVGPEYSTSVSLTTDTTSTTSTISPTATTITTTIRTNPMTSTTTSSSIAIITTVTSSSTPKTDLLTTTVHEVTSTTTNAIDIKPTTTNTDVSTITNPDATISTTTIIKDTCIITTTVTGITNKLYMYVYT